MKEWLTRERRIVLLVAGCLAVAASIFHPDHWAGGRKFFLLGPLRASEVVQLFIEWLTIGILTVVALIALSLRKRPQ